jgi:hypothetical protein
VSNAKLESLIRMAVEIDELEQFVAAGTGEMPASGRPNESGRIVGGNRTALPFDRRPFRRSAWRSGLGAAAAAACLLLLIHPWSAESGPHIATAAPIEIDYCPGLPLHDGVRIDRFEPTTTEHCVVLAIFHTWQDECQCLAWQLHEWENGDALVEVTPGQELDIALDVTNAPPVEQLLLVAISRDPAQLPRTAEQTYELMDCLNEVTPPTDPCDSVAAYTSAVQACLAEGVRVVPRPFFVE